MCFCIIIFSLFFNKTEWKKEEMHTHARMLKWVRSFLSFIFRLLKSHFTSRQNTPTKMIIYSKILTYIAKSSKLLQELYIWYHLFKIANCLIPTNSAAKCESFAFICPVPRFKCENFWRSCLICHGKWMHWAKKKIRKKWNVSHSDQMET